MNLIKCPNNHIYNADHYPSCPDCASLKILGHEQTESDQQDIITDTIERSVTELNISANSPIVGWLVCIDGADYGSIFPLHSGTNAIGRGANMDIHISNDPEISRYIHACITYNNSSVSYNLYIRDSVNTVTVNNIPIAAENDKSIILHNRDRIRIGKTTFLFIALCGDDFAWEE